MDFPGRFMVFMTRDCTTENIRSNICERFRAVLFPKKDRLLLIQGPCVFTQDHSNEKSVWFGTDKIYGPEKLNIRS